MISVRLRSTCTRHVRVDEVCGLSGLSVMVMSTSDSILQAPGSLPNCYSPVTLFSSSSGAPLRLSIVVRKAPDVVAWHFVVLRTLLDAVVYLGCVTDTAGCLHGY